MTPANGPVSGNASRMPTAIDTEHSATAFTEYLSNSQPKPSFPSAPATIIIEKPSAAISGPRFASRDRNSGM